jgi:hypothetical protein
VNDLVSALLFVAEDLDRRAYPFAGAVRQGARRLAELEAWGNRGAPGACPGCGVGVTQPARGRRRIYCSERCRRRRGRVGNERPPVGREGSNRSRVLHFVKTTAGCMDCGMNEGTLKFDHRDPATKAFTIGDRSFWTGSLPWAQLWDEVAKCDVRCMPCHRQRHGRERRARNGAKL